MGRVQDGSEHWYCRTEVTELILLHGEYRQVAMLARVLGEPTLLPSTLCCWFGFDPLPLYPLVAFPERAFQVLANLQDNLATRENLRRVACQSQAQVRGD